MKGTSPELKNGVNVLRSRHGGWQGYIAELLDDTVAPIEIDLIKRTFWLIRFIADWIFLKDAQSWPGLQKSNAFYDAQDC